MIFDRPERPCPDCGDVGVVFVKSHIPEMKTIAMGCLCGKEKYFNLVKYTPDHVIVENPYLQLKKRKVQTSKGWTKIVERYRKHMIRSREVMNGNA